MIPLRVSYYYAHLFTPDANEAVEAWRSLFADRSGRALVTGEALVTRDTFESFVIWRVNQVSFVSVFSLATSKT